MTPDSTATPVKPTLVRNDWNTSPENEPFRGRISETTFRRKALAEDTGLGSER